MTTYNINHENFSEVKNGCLRIKTDYMASMVVTALKDYNLQKIQLAMENCDDLEDYLSDTIMLYLDDMGF